MSKPNTSSLTICTLQPAVTWKDSRRTFDHVSELLAQAVGQAPIDVALLPEHFNAIEESEGETRQFDAARAFCADLARHHSIHLVAGSVEHYDSQRGALVNTSLVFDRAGNEHGRYDKRMLYGYEKRRNVQPGQHPLVVTLSGVRCGVLICSDLWHPELVRDLAPDIDLLCVPAQTTIRPESPPAYARMLWRSLAMTRAQENVIAVAVSDSATTSDTPFGLGGVSSITDPSAEADLAAIQQTLEDGQDGYLLAEIDLHRLAEFRAYRRGNGMLPVASHG